MTRFEKTATAIAAVAIISVATFLPTAIAAEATSKLTADGWRTTAPRDEIRPDFAYLAGGGPDGWAPATGQLHLEEVL